MAMCAHYLLTASMLICELHLHVAATTSRPNRKRVTVMENVGGGQTVANVAHVFGIQQENRDSQFMLLDQKIDAETTWNTIGNSFGNKDDNSQSSNGGWFDLDPRTGLLSLVRSLDREKLCRQSPNCIIFLKIYYESKVLDLEVEVDDVNDNRPRFAYKQISVNVSEATTTGDFISLDAYMAVDLDSAGRNSEIRYSLTPNEEFSVDEYLDSSETQHLRLNVLKALDYERKAFYQLKLRARDGGVPSLEADVSLLINVLDVNDNSPVFDEQMYQVMVSENTEPGQTIITVHAKDADSGDAGRILYFLARENSGSARYYVKIDPETGRVVLKERLDRERLQSLKIEIEARDMDRTSARRGSTQLVIYITDVNDNSPEVNLRFIVNGHQDTVYVPESTTRNFYLIYVSVKDQDSGVNGEVDLTLTTVGSNPDMFLLNKEKFIVLNGELDREKVDRYKLQLKACDRGRDQRCSQKTIDLVVLDVNEFAPEFSQEFFTVDVFEDAKIGSLIAELKAYDKDSINSPALQETKDQEIKQSSNGVITYSLKGGSSVFEIQPKTGFLNTRGRLDRERHPVWKLTICARDGGNPPRQSTCDLTVNILDKNDNKPVFTNPMDNNSLVYATILREHTIMRIRAIDSDAEENAKISYNTLYEDDIPYPIAVENGSSLFLLNKDTGDLRMNMSHPNLKEKIGEHKITVEAKDGGTPSQANVITLRIKVTDKKKLPLPEVRDSENYNNLLQVSPALIVVMVIVAVLAVAILSVYLYATCECKETICKATKLPISYTKTCSMKKAQSFETLKHLNKENIQSRIKTSGSETDIGKLAQKKEKSEQESTTASSYLTWNEGHQNSPRETSPPLPLAHSDVDSGRGDSDPGRKSTLAIRGSAVAYSWKKAGSAPQKSELGRHCSIQCLRHGHGDTCWMPMIGEKQVIVTEEVGDYNLHNSELAADADISDAITTVLLETIPETGKLSSRLHLTRSPDFQNNRESIALFDAPPTYASGNNAPPLPAQQQQQPKTRESFVTQNNCNSSESVTTGYVSEHDGS